MNFSASDAAPYLIRLAALVIIAAVVFDFFGRRRANKIVSALKEADALSEDKAIPLDGLGKWVKRTLKPSSSLRRVVFPAGDGWYLNETDEDGVSRIPASLRDGAERGTAKLIIGIVLTVAGAELIVHFFPQIAELFGKGKEIFN